MKLSILGARGAYPNKNEGCSSYLIQDEGFNLLLDCGSGAVSSLQNHINLIDLNAVILSHYHADHFSDISILQNGIMIESSLHDKKINIPIYAHDKNSKFKDLNFKSYTTGKAYQENSCLVPGPFIITFLKTKHSKTCFAMRISNAKSVIVYTADTAYFEKLVDFSSNADLLIAESSLYPEQEEQNKGHMTSSSAARLAEKAEAKELLLTHLPNYGDNNKLLNDAHKYYQGPIQLAAGGLSREI